MNGRRLVEQESHRYLASRESNVTQFGAVFLERARGNRSSAAAIIYFVPVLQWLLNEGAATTGCPFEVIQWRHPRAQSVSPQFGATSAGHSLCWLVQQTDGKTNALLDDSYRPKAL